MQLGEKSGLKPANQLRSYFGEALLERATENPKIVVLDGDLGNSTGASTVRNAFPDRFFNLGIAESNMISVSGGLAASGYIPFATSLTSFLLCNAFEQIRLTIAISSLNVKLVGSHSGLTTGREGPSSMSIEDYSLLGALPTFTILVPSDPSMMRKAVKAAVAIQGPVFIRSSRAELPFIYPEENCPFEIGKANQIRDGKDVTIIACGLMVPLAMDAGLMLAEEGIEARILDMHTLRPLDKEVIEKAARDTGAIVTAEEQLIRGGMGAAVSQVVVGRCPVPMRFIGLNDEYCVSGSLDELIKKYHLMPEDIAEAARQAIKAKNQKRN